MQLEGTIKELSLCVSVQAPVKVRTGPLLWEKHTLRCPCVIPCAHTCKRGGRFRTFPAVPWRKGSALGHCRAWGQQHKLTLPVVLTQIPALGRSGHNVHPGRGEQPLARGSDSPHRDRWMYQSSSASSTFECRYKRKCKHSNTAGPHQLHGVGIPSSSSPARLHVLQTPWSPHSHTTSPLCPTLDLPLVLIMWRKLLKQAETLYSGPAPAAPALALQISEE